MRSGHAPPPAGGPEALLRLPTGRILPAFALAAMLAMTLVVTGAVLHAGEPVQVTVLNPKSYPLVGGTWAVDLDVKGGGTLTVSAVDGTAFGDGGDIKFAEMYHHDSRTALTPSSVWGGGALHFEDVREGRYALDVNVLTAGPHHLRFDLTGGGAAYASNTASLANVTSTTDDGAYGPGDVIDVRIGFTEPVSLDRFAITDGSGDATGSGTFDTLDAPLLITTTTIGDSVYALVASISDDGVQIIDITDPTSPTATASVTDGVGGFDRLDGAVSVATATIGDYHYALVASFSDDGVQIINITNPASPTATASVTHDSDFDELDAPRFIVTTAIGASTYALVAAATDDGVQIIDITDPTSPTATASVAHNVGGFDRLDGAYSVATVTIDGSHYALVAAEVSDGVQIIDITNPASPAAVASVTDGDADSDGNTFDELNGPRYITTITIGTSIYALVAGYADDGIQIIDITTPTDPKATASVQDDTTANPTDFDRLDAARAISTTAIGDSIFALITGETDDGVQIIDITNPASPTAVASVVDSEQDSSSVFGELNGAYASVTTSAGGRHYALVTASADDGVQVIDITDPANPFDALAPYVEMDTAAEPGRATYVGLDGNYAVFKYVVRPGDSSSDLDYAGTGSLHLGHSVLKDASDSMDLSDPLLPVPEAPHSLSHNKNIRIGDAAPSADAFVTTWKTNSASESISIPVEVHAGGTLTISWGDGSTDTVDTSSTVLHTYSASGEYQVNMTGGLARINLGASDSTAGKLASIDSWGDIGWSSMDGAFRGASSMEYAATDVPDLSGVTSMRYMFFNVAAFDGDLSGWDVSNVENMVATFYGTSFDGDISGWDVSSVTTMDAMFYNAGSFNQDLSSWNTASVTDMNAMFGNAGSFNRNLPSWNTASVTDMSDMFNEALSFDGDISGWDVSSVTDMSFMFRSTPFAGDLSGWDVSSVVDMNHMFSDTDDFNSDISSWNVAAVTDMGNMFNDATKFNSDISSWNVAAVANMDRMFNGATAFNSDISSWNVAAATNMNSMLGGADSFHQNLGEWYVVPGSTDIDRTDVPGVVGSISAQNGILAGHSPTYGIGTGGDSALFEIVSGSEINMTAVQTKSAYGVNVTASGTGVFEDGNNWLMVDVTVIGTSPPPASAFVTTWATTGPDESVTIPATGTYTIDWGDGTVDAGVTGTQTHEYAAAGTHTVSISGGLESIRVGNATAANAAKLQSIEQWGNIEWTTMNEAFQDASNMVYGATDSPDLSGVTDMSLMFARASSFDGDISGWDVSSVTDMKGTFGVTASFNRDLNDWDVSSVTDMKNMFAFADSFDGDISGWNVSSVEDMAGMFDGATVFNRDISNWNVSSVTAMTSMFRDADAFDQNLGKWAVTLDDASIDLSGPRRYDRHPLAAGPCT